MSVSTSSGGYVRRLGMRDAALVVMGGIIGGGIFLNPGTAAPRTGSGLALCVV